VSTPWNGEHCVDLLHFLQYDWRHCLSIPHHLQGTQPTIQDKKNNEESSWKILPNSYVCLSLKLAILSALWWETIPFEVQNKWCLNDGLCHHKTQQLPLPCIVVVIDLPRSLEVVIFQRPEPETMEGEEKLRCCMQPVCNEHSVSKTTCNICENNWKHKRRIGNAALLQRAISIKDNVMI